MPQLDTIYIMTIYMWTWLMLYTTMEKIKTYMMTHPQPQQQIMSKLMKMPPLPWL